MSNYPVTCSFGHSPQQISDEAALQTHITSEHSNGDIAAIRRALVSSHGGSSDAIPQVTLTSALTRLGIKADDLHSISESELSGAADITPESFLSFLSAFGQKQEPSINPSIPFFLLDFFILVLRTASSEETDSAGGFTLRENGGAGKVFVTWSSFRSDAISHYKNLNVPFTIRKLMRTLDDALWEMWQDSKTSALDTIRKNGTALSRRWTYPDGSKPKAYVVVPELFSNHLTPSERHLRIATSDKIRKVSSNGAGDVSYEGYDADQDYAERADSRKNRLSASVHSLASQSSPDDGYVRPWQSLKPSRGGGVGFR